MGLFGNRRNSAQRERDRNPRLRAACAACGATFTKARPSTVCADGYRVHAGACGKNGTLVSGIGGWR